MAVRTRYRLWIAGVMAAVAIVLAAIAAAVPFLEAPPGGVAASIATLFIAAEVFSALAILIVGKDLYGKIWAKLQSMRSDNTP